MEHPIGALPRTPFPASRDFPSRGNEKIGGTGYCVTYDTDSQSRNADFILIARKGDTTTLGPKGRQTYEPSGPKDRSILRTLPHNADFISIARRAIPQPSAPQALSPPERKRTQPFYTTRGESRAPFLKSAASAATTTL